MHIVRKRSHKLNRRHVRAQYMHMYVVFSTRPNDNTSHDNKSGIRRVRHRTSKIASFKKQWTLITKIIK